MPAFEVAVICEKGNQAKALRKAYNLTEVKKLGDIGNVYYDKAFKMCVGHLQGHLLELMPPEYYAPSLRRDKEGWNRAALPVIPPGERWKLEPKKDNRPREKAKIKAAILTSLVINQRRKPRGCSKVRRYNGRRGRNTKHV